MKKKKDYSFNYEVKQDKEHFERILDVLKKSVNNTGQRKDFVESKESLTLKKKNASVVKNKCKN